MDQEDILDIHSYIVKEPERSAHREPSERFLQENLGRYGVEFDRARSELRISWSGGQMFLVEQEPTRLFAFLREVHLESSQCVFCGQEVKKGQYCEKCSGLFSHIWQGIELLDACKPGWHRSPALCIDALDMARHGLCLLSCLFGSYDMGIRLLNIGPLVIEEDLAGEVCLDPFGWEYGFTLSPQTPLEDMKRDFARLTAIWKIVIIGKRLLDILGEEE